MRASLAAVLIVTALAWAALRAITSCDTVAEL